jgi:excisionase family DNA binding protein
MTIPGEGKRLLTLHDIAEFTQQHYDTIYEKARSGRIPGAFKMGGVWRVRPEVFKAWVGRGCPRVRVGK